MKLTRSNTLLAAVLTLGLALQGYSADRGRIFRSLVYPGMGQLADGETVKGLAFMTVETVLLSLVFRELTRTNSYARDTEYLRENYDLAGTYEERIYQDSLWNASYDNSERARTMTVVYGGIAVLAWVLNVVDAVLFPPRGSGDEASIMRKIKENTMVSATPDKAELRYRILF